MGCGLEGPDLAEKVGSPSQSELCNIRVRPDCLNDLERKFCRYISDHCLLSARQASYRCSSATGSLADGNSMFGQLALGCRFLPPLPVLVSKTDLRERWGGGGG